MDKIAEWKLCEVEGIILDKLVRRRLGFVRRLRLKKICS